MTETGETDRRDAMFPSLVEDVQEFIVRKFHRDIRQEQFAARDAPLAAQEGELGREHLLVARSDDDVEPIVDETPGAFRYGEVVLDDLQ